MSDKIKALHLERKAILYIRQSSIHQVLHHQESQKLQYAVRDRLRQLGWREIDVVDEDFGHSASGRCDRCCGLANTPFAQASAASHGLSGSMPAKSSAP